MGNIRVWTDEKSHSPEEDLHMDDRKEYCKDQDEPFVIMLELPVILNQGIESRQNIQQYREPNHEDRDEKHAPEYWKVSINIPRCIPVRGNQVREAGIHTNRDRDYQEDYCNHAIPYGMHYIILGYSWQMAFFMRGSDIDGVWTRTRGDYGIMR